MASTLGPFTAGTERLKEALQAVGLKAGGTAEQRAARLMLLRDTPLDKLDRKHFAKGVLPAVRPPAAAPVGPGHMQPFGDICCARLLLIKRFHIM